MHSLRFHACAIVDILRCRQVTIIITDPAPSQQRLDQPATLARARPIPDGSQLIYGSSGIFIPRLEIGYILVGGTGFLAYCSVTDLLSDSILSCLG